MMDHLDTETTELLKNVSLYWLNNAFPEMIYDVDEMNLKDTLINEWKCALRDEVCLEYVSTSYENFKQVFRLANNNYDYLIFCNTLKISSNVEEDFNFILDQFIKSKSAYKRKMLLRSLACVSDKNIQERFLQGLLNESSTIINSEVAVVINAMLENRNQGPEIVINFLENNLDELIQKYQGYISFASLILSVAKKT